MTKPSLFSRLFSSGHTKPSSNLSASSHSDGYQKLSYWPIWVLVVFLPVFFLPLTNSPLELNKLGLLISLGGFAGLIWVFCMVRSRRFNFSFTSLNLASLASAIALLISSFFSVYKTNSFWGFTGGEAGASVTCMLS